MAIDQTKFRNELDIAIALARTAINDLAAPLLDNGFTVPTAIALDVPPLWSSYASGRFFFQRVFYEMEKALALLEELTNERTASSDLQSQRAFDEVSLRQRKVFETFSTIIMLSRPAIYASAAPPGMYFLHFHLSHESEYFRLRNEDLKRYFGGTCATTKQLQSNRERMIQSLFDNYKVDPLLCTWTGNARAKFENVVPECSPLEKAAIGFGYLQVFGAASSQVHLNMTGLYSPIPTEQEFIKRVDNLMLLCICVILRAATIAELAHQANGQGSLTLRTEFSGGFPDSYVTAALGAAVAGDIVAVFESPDIFLANIEEKRGGNGQIAPDTVEATVKATENANKAAKAAAASTEAAQRAETAAAVIPSTSATTEAARTAAQEGKTFENTAVNCAKLAAIAAGLASPPPAAVPSPPHITPATPQQNATATKAVHQAKTSAAAATASAAAAATSAEIAAKASAEYVSYTVQPFNNVGRQGAFTDGETMVILRGNDIQEVLQEAVTAGLITQDVVNAGDIFALTKILESGGMAQFIQPRMNNATLTYLYFVQRYLNRNHEN